MPKRWAFDRAYYERFYAWPRLRAGDREAVAVLGDFVCAYLRYLGQPVRRVLDLGCAMGFWRDVVARQHPRARYTGVEISAFLCERYGWTHGSVVDFRARAPFDLVICTDVLQYLPDAAASAAIGNLAALCRGALYFNLLTREDWEENCDRERTNGEVHLRSADWYRRRLRRHFVAAGGGVFISPRSPVVMWELEKLASGREARRGARARAAARVRPRRRCPAGDADSRPGGGRRTRGRRPRRG
jgi:SAM-dependent methyltransferase